jgi:hypothetical protein
MRWRVVLFGSLFDVVSRTGIIAEVDHASESIEHVTDGNVECFAKYSVPLSSTRGMLGTGL